MWLDWRYKENILSFLTTKSLILCSIWITYHLCLLITTPTHHLHNPTVQSLPIALHFQRLVVGSHFLQPNFWLWNTTAYRQHVLNSRNSGLFCFFKINLYFNTRWLFLLSETLVYEWRNACYSFRLKLILHSIL